MNENAPCGKCGGMLYEETDQWGVHCTCHNCGASRVIVIRLNPSLWVEGEAATGPGGPRGAVLNRPYGKVLPR